MPSNCICRKSSGSRSFMNSFLRALRICRFAPFVTKGAKRQILKERKREFIEERLPELFRQMRLLDIDIKDVAEAWEKDA